MPIETTVTVAVVSEVSARVLPNASNTVMQIATSTPDVGFVQSVIEFIMSLF